MANAQEFALAHAEKKWQSEKTQKKIVKLYKDVAKSIEKAMQNIPEYGTVSESIRKNYLDDYVKKLNKEIQGLQAKISDATIEGMYGASDAVVTSNNDFMGKAGLTIEGAFSYVPTQVIESLVSGKVYAGDWSFSKALWQGTQKTQKDIQTVVARGLAEQKPTYDIAKDLEKYLNPSAKKDWDWSKVYPGTNKKVDYSAQRLARTLIQHSYQLSYRRVVANNPFVEGTVWHSAFSSRSCELCMERDGTIYEKGSEPLDHPQGLCYLEAYIPKSMEQISDELADWALGAENPALDKYAKSMGFTAEAVQNNVAQAAISKSVPLTSEWIGMIKQTTVEEMLDSEEIFFNSLSAAEKAGLRDYTGSTYQEMNSYLRKLAAGWDEKSAKLSAGLSDFALEDLKFAQQALSKTRLEKPLVLRRGTDLGDLAGLFNAREGKDFSDLKSELKNLTTEQLAQKYVGATGEYAGFTSTSSIWDKGFNGDVEVVFYAPEGTQGSSIMKISRFRTAEGEFLLNAGTRVKIADIKKSDGHKGSYVRIFMEIL